MIQDTLPGGLESSACSPPASYDHLKEQSPSPPSYLREDTSSAYTSCEHCGESFTHAQQLHEHIRSQHPHSDLDSSSVGVGGGSGSRNHVCQECGKGFATSSGLKQHTHIHSSVKPFQCEVCLKAYTQFSNLCRHKRMHADCRQQIKCHECGQSFSTLHSLNKHKRFCEGVMRSGVRLPHAGHAGLGGPPTHALPPSMASRPPSLSPGQLHPSMYPSPIHPMAAAAASHQAALQAYMSMYGQQRPAFPFLPGALPMSGIPGGHPFLPGATHGASPSGMDFAKMMHESMRRNLEMTRLMEERMKKSGGSEVSDSGSDIAAESAHETKDAKQEEDLEEDQNGWDSGLDSAPVDSEAKSAPGSGKEDIEEGKQSPLRPNETSTPKENHRFFERSDAKSPSPVVIRPLNFSSPEPQFTHAVAASPSKVANALHIDIPKVSPQVSEPSPKVAKAEQPLDLTVKHRSPKLHEHSPSLKRYKSRSPSPQRAHHIATSPITPIARKPTSTETPLYKPPTIENLKERSLMSGSSMSSSPYPIPNPFLLSRMFGVPEDKLQSLQSMPSHHHPMNYPGAGYPPKEHHPSQFPHRGPFMPPHHLQPHLPHDISPDKASLFPNHPMSISNPFLKLGGGRIPGYHHYQAGFNGGKHKYACKFCGKVFPRSANLTRHLRTHTGEQPYKCKYCERSFSISSNLQRHIRNIHNKEKPYRCQICDRSFGQQTNLDRHLKKHEYGTLDTSLDDSLNDDMDVGEPLGKSYTCNDVNGNESDVRVDDDIIEDDDDDLDIAERSNDVTTSPVTDYRHIDSSFSISALIGTGHSKSQDIFPTKTVQVDAN